MLPSWLRFLPLLVLSPFLLASCQPATASPVPVATDTPQLTNTPAPTATEAVTATVTDLPTEPPTEIWTGDPVPDWSMQEVAELQGQGIEVDLHEAVWSDGWQGYVRTDALGNLTEWLSFENGWNKVADIVELDGYSILVVVNENEADLQFMQEHPDYGFFARDVKVGSDAQLAVWLQMVDDDFSVSSDTPTLAYVESGYIPSLTGQYAEGSFQRQRILRKKRVIQYSLARDSFSETPFDPKPTAAWNLLERKSWVVNLGGTNLDVINAYKPYYQGSLTEPGIMVLNNLIIVENPTPDRIKDRANNYLSRSIYKAAYNYDSDGYPIDLNQAHDGDAKHEWLWNQFNFLPTVNFNPQLFSPSSFK